MRNGWVTKALIAKHGMQEPKSGMLAARKYLEAHARQAGEGVGFWGRV